MSEPHTMKTIISGIAPDNIEENKKINKYIKIQELTKLKITSKIEHLSSKEAEIKTLIRSIK